VINYYVDKKSTNISLEILDAANTVIRKYSNADTLYTIPDVNIPHYWIRPQQLLSAEAGSHRFMWDMHYTPLNVPPAYPISATYMNTAPSETSPWVLPGKYTARLTVDGKVSVQSFEVKMDPRVKTSMVNLQLQHSLSLMCYNNILKAMKAKEKMKAGTESLTKFIRNFSSLHNALQESDWPPTTQMINATKEKELQFNEYFRKVNGQW
jgi:hypothetical protein